MGTKKSLGHNHAGAGRGVAGDKCHVVAAETNAAFGRIAATAPCVQENGGAFARFGVWLVPVCEEDHVIRRIGATEFFVAGPIGRLDMVVVVRLSAGV